MIRPCNTQSKRLSLSHCLLAALIVVVLGAETLVSAQSPQPTLKRIPIPPDLNESPGVCFIKQLTRLYVPMTGGRFDVSMSRNSVGYVRFPESVTLTDTVYHRGGFIIDQDPHEIIIAPGNKLKIGDRASLLIKVGDLRLTMDMKVTDDKQRASAWYVKPLPVQDFHKHKVREQLRQAERAREDDKALMRQYRSRVAQSLLELNVVTASSQQSAVAKEGIDVRYAPEGEVRAVLVKLLGMNNDRYLELVIDNNSMSSVKLGDAWLAEGLEEGVPVQAILETEPSGSNGEPVEIPAKRKVRGMVVIPPNVTGGLEVLRVKIDRVGSITDIVAQQVVELWPKMPEHIARKRRWAKQLSLSVQGVFGGFWTDDAAGQDMTAGASVTGLSLRITKGMHQNFAFEGEITGGKSGDIRFRNVSWQETQGDVTRSASFGRMKVAGVIRFGQEYVLATRIGLGVQGTDYDSRFVAGGDSMNGPGNNFKMDGLVSLGIGFDARIGEHWTFGAGASFLSAWKTEVTSLEGSFLLGYRWSP